MNLQDVLIRPIVTEKAETLRGIKCFTFEVSSRCNKPLVRSAIKEVYGVTPKKVNIVNTIAKKKQNKFGNGSKPKRRKAYVFLDEKDNIELFEV